MGEDFDLGFDEFDPFDEDPDRDYYDRLEDDYYERLAEGQEDDFPMYLEYEGPFGLSGYDEL